jgi:capsular polysaccharide export protein
MTLARVNPLSKGAVGVLSKGILRIRHLSALMGEDVIRISSSCRDANGLTGVAAWGRRPTARKAQQFALRYGIARILCLEDGFLRSLHPGAESPACSLVLDDLGIYYDATVPSRLEAMIAMPLSTPEAARVQRLIGQWCVQGVSKYNYARDPASLPDRPYVLVIDQTANDASVRYGQADAGSFQRMLEAAMQRYPGNRVVVKEHPEVKLGRKRGYLGALLDTGKYPGVLRLRDDVHVVPLLRQATAVFVVTSQVGFEALLHGRPVHTFGMPFYAGWGLTHDALPSPERRGMASREQLVFAALVRYTRYISPHTGERCEVEDAVEHFTLQRRMRQQFPARLHALGFSRWKRPVLRRFLAGHAVQFHRSLRTVPVDSAVLCWGRSRDMTARTDLTVITVEDGFLRSVGLGAQLVRPVSWVFDDTGIYYDATCPSALENLLNDTYFDDAMLARAARLSEEIVRAGMTKYNVGRGTWQRPANVPEVILVVGQVESDASLRLGAPAISTNRALLESVRKTAPDAYVIYKPHPDVMAGLRGSREAEAALSVLCDELVPDYPMHQLIDVVDRVHVLTSLAGFEALLRGKPVTTHGMPFYAGWGLTEDRCRNLRRQRELSLPALVAGALIMYPRYVSRDPQAGFAAPEQVLADLLFWRTNRPESGNGLLRRIMQPLLRHWARPAVKGRT